MAFNISTNFLLGAGLPLDARTVVADIAARDAIAAIERYDGLPVYVLSDNNTYQLQGGITNGDWVGITGPGSSNLWTDNTTYISPTLPRSVYIDDGYLRVCQSAGTGSALPVVRIQSGNHTSLTAATALEGFSYYPTTKEWDGSAPLAEQSEWIICSPTYAFTAPQVITDAYTCSITAAPTAGANCTITNSYAFGCGGNANFLGKVFLKDTSLANDPAIAFVQDKDTGIRRKLVGSPSKSSFDFLIDGTSAGNIQTDNIVCFGNITASGSNPFNITGSSGVTGPCVQIDNIGTISSGSICEFYNGSAATGTLSFNVLHDGGFLSGPLANRTNWPHAFGILTKEDTGYTNAANTKYGFIAETVCDATYGGIGIEGIVKLNGTRDGIGVAGFVGQNDITDTGIAAGVSGNVFAIRTIGENRAVYGFAFGSVDGNYAFYGDGGSMKNSGRFLGKKGTSVASANDMQLSDGNYFLITGNTTINRIRYDGPSGVPDWTPGSIVTLRFTSPNTTVVNGGGTAGVYVGIRLLGAVNFVAQTGDTLTLALDDTTTYWYEVARTVV